MEEKLKILKMLEEGKITPEQAANLLKAINASQDTPQDHHTRHAHHSHQGNNGAPPPSPGHKGLGLDDFASEMRTRFSELAKEWEPKIKTIAGVMAEKTAVLADRMAKNIDPKPGEYHQRATPPPTSPTPNPTEHSFELKVEGSSKELVLSGHNAPVTIKGYNGDKISAKVICRPKHRDAHISLVCHGDKYILNYDDTAFYSIALDAYVPESLFRSVRFLAENATLHISGLVVDNITATNTNEKLEALNITAKTANIESTNGIISTTNLDAENLKVETSNAPINLSIAAYSKYHQYNWHIETSNGRIFANIPSTPDLGYHLEAASALGNVKIGLINLTYLQNTASIAKARSTNYDLCAKRVRLSLETSSADIVVN